MKSREAPVRWREDTGWELRCESCAAQHRQRFWPLTHEFWQPKWGMSRCRACVKEAERAHKRERYATDPAYRDAKKQQSIAVRAANGRVNRVLDAKRYAATVERLSASPDELERYKEQRRAANARYRARRREDVAA